MNGYEVDTGSHPNRFVEESEENYHNLVVTASCVHILRFKICISQLCNPLKGSTFHYLTIINDIFCNRNG